MNKTRQCKIAGAILAGGKASRLGGIAKGAIQTPEGMSIVEHLIRGFQSADIDPIVILANDPQPYRDYGLKILKDLRSDFGPLAGIETALSYFAKQADAVMFVPCDIPNLTAKELRLLKDAFVHSKSGIVCAETSDFFWHPLCTVVHNEVLAEITSAMDNGQSAVSKLWKQLGAETLFFDDRTPFLNINTAADIRQWRKDKNDTAYVC